MKKIITLLLLVVLLTACSVGSKSYAQLSGGNDQEITNEPMVVQFEQVDGVNGVAVSPDSVVVNKDGSWLVVAAPQVTAKLPGGCLDLWLTVNNSDVENSSVRLCQTEQGDTDVIISQGVLELKKDDTVQIVSSASGAFLDAIQPDFGPLVPSIIVTVIEQ